MFGLFGGRIGDSLSLFLLKEYLIIFIISIVCAFPVFSKIPERIKNSAAAVCIKNIAAIVILFVCCAFMLTGKYNPFLYFNF